MFASEKVLMSTPVFVLEGTKVGLDAKWDK